MGLDMTAHQDNGGFSAAEIRRARGYATGQPRIKWEGTLIASELIIAEEHAEIERIARDGRL